MSDFYFIPGDRLGLSETGKNRIKRFEGAVLGVLLTVFRGLPFRAGRWLAEKVTAAVGMRGRRAKGVRRNLTVAFPDQPPAVVDHRVRATFGHLGQAMAELAHLDKIWAANRVEFKIAAGAIRPRTDRPTVFVTAHVGGFQLTPFIARQYGLDMPIIYSPERNPYVDRRINGMRGAYQSRMIPNEGGLLSFVRALRTGQSVAMTVDTRLDGAPELPFFGVDAPTNTGPAFLAVRYDIDLVPVRGERLAGGHYRITVLPPIRPSDSVTKKSVRVEDMTRQLNTLFESWIRESPGQWMCFKRRWTKDTYRRLGISGKAC